MKVTCTFGIQWMLPSRLHKKVGVVYYYESCRVSITTIAQHLQVNVVMPMYSLQLDTALREDGHVGAMLLCHGMIM